MTQAIYYLFLFHLVLIVRASPDFNFAGSFNPSDFFTRGTKPVSVGGNIVLTTAWYSQTGAAFYNTSQQRLENGFTTRFQVRSQACDDSNYENPFGFAFVISAMHPEDQPFEIYGGGLGASNYSNVIIVGYTTIPYGGGYISLCAVNSTSLNGSDIFNSDRCQTIDAPDVLNYMCNGSPTYEIQFVPPSTWRMRTSVNFVGTITLDPTPVISSGNEVYLGFTASTVSNGYVAQTLNSWAFETNPDPVSEGIIPFLECFEYFNGDYFAYFGYDNTLNRSASAFGENNVLSGTTAVLPIVFRSGRLPFIFYTYWNTTDITWRLTNYLLAIDNDQSAHQCPPRINVKIAFTTPQQLTADDISQLLGSIAAYTGISSNRLNAVNATYSSQTKKRQGDSDLLADLEVEISQANSRDADEPSPAQVVTELVQWNNNPNDPQPSSVINPTGEEGRTFVGVDPLPTGAELPGKIIDNSVPLTVQPFAPSSTTPPPSQNNPVAKVSSATILESSLRLALLIVALYLA